MSVLSRSSMGMPQNDARQEDEGRRRSDARPRARSRAVFWPLAPGAGSRAQQHANAAQHVHRQQEHETVSASLTSGDRVQLRKPSSRASPSMASPSVRKCSGRKARAPGPRADAPAPRSTAHCARSRRCARVMAAPPRRPPAAEHRAAAAPNATSATSSARGRSSGVHSTSDGPHADRRVHGGGQHEQRHRTAPQAMLPRVRARMSAARKPLAASRRR